MQIYKTTNLVNGKFYIGKDTSDNPNYLGSGILLGYAIEKYGKENFMKNIIEKIENDKDLLAEKEIFWINFFRQHMNLTHMMYNIADGGEGGIGRIKGTPNPKKRRWVSIEGTLYQGVCVAATALQMPYQTLCCRLNNKKNYSEWFYVDSPKEKSEKQEVHGKSNGAYVSNAKEYLCPHCNKSGRGNGFKAWHFEKCSSKLLSGFKFSE